MYHSHPLNTMRLFPSPQWNSFSVFFLQTKPKVPPSSINLSWMFSKGNSVALVQMLVNQLTVAIYRLNFQWSSQSMFFLFSTLGESWVCAFASSGREWTCHLFSSILTAMFILSLLLQRPRSWSMTFFTYLHNPHLAEMRWQSILSREIKMKLRKRDGDEARCWSQLWICNHSLQSLIFKPLLHLHYSSTLTMLFLF